MRALEEKLAEAKAPIAIGARRGARDASRLGVTKVYRSSEQTYFAVGSHDLLNLRVKSAYMHTAACVLAKFK